ncbi:hypothetical protein LCGC14_1676970 [marine sediment metagenome]|uniref:Uncharacterized protein n=1 Tax=marine sediment metagenome TaxID=412755 RepID=A0A0F9K5E7_9ZZZZ
MAVGVDAANKYRQIVGQLLETHKQFMSIDKEYVAADIASGVSDGDFPDIDKAQFTSGVAAAQAIMAAIEVNKTNLYIMSDGSQR